MELRNRLNAAVVCELALLHDLGYATTILGRRASASRVLNGMFCCVSMPAYNTDETFSQFANLEQGEDSADVENSFA